MVPLPETHMIKLTLQSLLKNESGNRIEIQVLSVCIIVAHNPCWNVTIYTTLVTSAV